MLQTKRVVAAYLKQLVAWGVEGSSWRGDWEGGSADGEVARVERTGPRVPTKTSQQCHPRLPSAPAGVGLALNPPQPARVQQLSPCVWRPRLLSLKRASRAAREAAKAEVGLAGEGTTRNSGWPAWSSWWFPASEWPPLPSWPALRAGQGPPSRNPGWCSVFQWLPSCVGQAVGGQVISLP